MSKHRTSFVVWVGGVCLLLATYTTGFSQSISPPSMVRFFVEPVLGANSGFVPDSTSPTGFFIDSTGLTQTGVVFITLVDTSGVSDVHIALGTTSGASDIFDGIIPYDPSTSLGTNQTYARIGDKALIRVGLFSLQQIAVDSVHLQVKLEDTGGILTAPVSHVYGHPQ